MKKIVLMLLGLFSICVAFGQRNADPQLTALRNEKDPEVLKQKLNALKNGVKEQDMQLLADYYGAIHDTSSFSQTTADLFRKFPNGRAAFRKTGDELYAETDGPTNVKRYNTFVAQFGSLPEFKNNMFFQYAKLYVGLSFMHSQPSLVKPWIDKITDTTYKTLAYSYAARDLTGIAQYPDAEKLIKLSLADARRRGLHSRRDSSEFLEFARLASDILLKEKKYQEGWVYAKLTHDDIQSPKPMISKAWVPAINHNYLDYLVAKEKYKEAFPLMGEAVKDGSASLLVKEKFKTAYIIANGNSDGFDAYNAKLLTALDEKIKAEVAKKMVMEPSFDFAFTDAKGAPISLESLKGKVVVLDFWATWCGPCKASFPKMQLAVNKFKNDADVVFLFVHTWETTNDRLKALNDAINYLKENHYTFNLAMDYKLKGGDQHSSPGATGFKLGGIPSKLIIDKQGNVRFKILGGSNEGDDAFLSNMSAMIELTKAG